MNYQRIYDQIIDRAKERKLQGYKEKHHIVPKCMGGSNEKVNLVELTAREHFLCHWMLCRIYPENRKLGHAFWFMSKQNAPTQQRDYVVSSRTYAEAVSNLKFTEEHKEKIRKTRVGKKTIVHPKTKEIKYILTEELQIWLDMGWENTNYKKGTKGSISEEGSKKLSEKITKRLTGKTGLDAQAAKGPYTVLLESGQKHTAGSYPELSKITKISYSTLQNRVTYFPKVMKNGFAVGIGTTFIPIEEPITSQKGNTNNSSRVFKGMKSDMSKEGRQSLAQARRKHQTGKTGLQAQAAKGPYTVIFESGGKYTAGSYPELVKLTGIAYATLQERLNRKEGVIIRGWLIRRGE